MKIDNDRADSTLKAVYRITYKPRGVDSLH